MTWRTSDVPDSVKVEKSPQSIMDQAIDINTIFQLSPMSETEWRDVSTNYVLARKSVWQQTHDTNTLFLNVKFLNSL